MTPSNRRRFLQTASTVLLLSGPQIAWGARIIAVRLWPAEDYTRITIESDVKLTTTHQLIESPHRLAVDIHGLTLSPQLQDLMAKVQPDDPNVSGIRIGQNTANVVRMVVDLKQSISPQVFTLQPVAAYQHRLVFDLYPTHQIDPLTALINERLRDPIAPSGSSTLTPGSGQGLNPPHRTPVPSAGTETAVANDALGDLIAQLNHPSATVNVNGTSGQSPSRSGSAGSVRVTPPAPAPAPPSLQPPIKSRTDRLIIVALDPGHGGEDPGAIGPNGTREKDIVLAIAHRLRRHINESTINGNPMRAFMTRDADFFVPLGTRVAKARQVQADLFISIHADAFTNPKANGSSVYALSQRGATSAAARWLADKENRADLVGGVNVRSQDRHVQNALIDMSTTAQIRDSLQLGSHVLRQLGNHTRLHKQRVEQAGFAVLKSPDIPSILIETAFISNPTEEAKLRTAAYQEQIAESIMKGLRLYFAKNPPLARSRVA